MTKGLQRDEMIELLKRLGSAQDEDVLQAAREAHAQISAAGVSWEDLLVPDGASPDDVDDRAPDIEDRAPPPKATPKPIRRKPPRRVRTEPPVEQDGEHADSLALIDELLARRDISKHVRRELKDYKDDIDEGEFSTRDRRYILSLHKRLSKNN